MYSYSPKYEYIQKNRIHFMLMSYLAYVPIQLHTHFKSLDQPSATSEARVSTLRNCETGTANFISYLDNKSSMNIMFS